MEPSLAKKYPRAQKAFDTQDIFYASETGPLPASLSNARNRMAFLVDKFIPGTPEEKEAFVIAGAISLEPASGARMFGDPDYGTHLDAIMLEIIDAAQNPGTPASPRLAPLITTVMIARMEQTVEEVRTGALKIESMDVVNALKRAAVNDEICLVNLRNKDLKDLYETTQFAYFAALERAAERGNIPPKPPAPKS